LARRLGIGRRTGIDIPGEFAGLVPDAAWRDKGYDEYLKCAKKAKVTPGTQDALFACGGIERPWSQGDNVNLAVGQGDLQATPLQLATAYSTVANGGRVVRPHLGQAVEDGQGRLVQQIRKPARRKVDFSKSNQQAIMDGLRGAASEEDGTSADVFKGFPKDLPVYGKTGTAEFADNSDETHSWFIGYQDDVAFAVMVQKGGAGAEAAVPIVDRFLTALNK